jgi:hypothetical protein
MSCLPFNEGKMSTGVTEESTSLLPKRAVLFKGQNGQLSNTLILGTHIAQVSVPFA